MQIIGTSENLTTQQAADYLGYSRPTLIKLLDEYKIPISLVGKHRKIQFSDVIRLENKIKAERKKFLDDLALEDYELGRLEGFDPVKNARR
ncbi:MAG: helix-turn-helix domain-containing protein [Actinobacteria bacterium]|nr:helix-turn-helix domain-containing protein [Actinomycetota bacterium]